MADGKTVVRKAKMEDLEGIINLLCQLSPPKPGEENDEDKGRAILKGIMNNPDYCLCTAWLDGEMVGTATLLIQRNLSHGGKSYAHLENVVTDIKFRGKGIGKEMVKFLVEEARESGCYKVILNCETKNVPFYERCGFLLTGEVEMRLTP